MTAAVEGVAASAALVITGLALLAGALTLAATRRPGLALGVLLDLLLAAGLLRLTGSPGEQSLAVAAVVVLLRHLVGAGLRLNRRARSGGAAVGPPGRVGRLRAEVLPRLVRPAWRS